MTHTAQNYAARVEVAGHRFFDVKVRQSATDPTRYEWKVYDGDRRRDILLRASAHTYATEQEALRHGNAASREIRNAFWRQSSGASTIQTSKKAAAVAASGSVLIIAPRAAPPIQPV
jgi:hypothetical protein